MGKTKKVKISAAKRTQHLKSKKRNTKIKIAQIKADKLKKKYNTNGIENLHTISDNKKKVKKKPGKEQNKLENVGDYDLNDEEIVANIKDVLDDEDRIDDYSEEFQSKREKKFDLSDEDETPLHELEYANKNLETSKDSKIEINLLPIKNKDGEIIMRTSKLYHNEIRKPNLNAKKYEELDNEIQSADEELEDSDDDVVNDEGIDKINIENKKFVSTTDLLILRQQEIDKQKYRIGIICSGVLEKPEEKIKNLKALFNLVDEQNENGSANFFTVRKLACISLAEIFKDILPEYRVGQVDPKMTTIRKTTLERITYENILLHQFKKYLTKLEKVTSYITKKNASKSPHKEKMCEVAVICLCEILNSHPYFNYVQNVAQLLVYMLNCQNKKIRERVNECFKNLFLTDSRLDMTLFVIRRINHLIKTKSNNVHIEMIRCCMSLKIKNVNLDAEKENELKVKKLENFRKKIWNMSKKERKREKKLRGLNKELQETKAEENKETKYYKLTEITKMLFTIYFRVLKNDPNSKLMSACLEGLAEFAHVINLDYFGDLIEILHDLLESSNLGYREELHCIGTVFAILSGQGEALNIDPIRFYSHLYKNLLQVNADFTHSDILILLKILDDVLIKRRKYISNQRSLAFVKRILTLSLQLLHNGSLGCLGIVKTLLQLSTVLDIVIDTDCSSGSGKFDPWLEDPEYCNASCTSLYETALLARHYHPTVRKFALYIASGAPALSNDSLPSDIAKLNIQELYTNYDSSEMAFNPSIPVPKLSENKRKFKAAKVDTPFIEYCENFVEKLRPTEINFYQQLQE